MKQTTLNKTIDNMHDDAHLTLNDALQAVKSHAADLTLREMTRERLINTLNAISEATQEAFDVINDDKSYRSILYRVADALLSRDVDASLYAECDDDEHFPVVRLTRATTDLARDRHVFCFLTSDAHDTWTVDMLDEQQSDTIDHIDTYIVRTCNDEHVIADALMKATDILLKRAAVRAQQRPSDDDHSASAVAFRERERAQQQQVHAHNMIVASSIVDAIMTLTVRARRDNARIIDDVQIIDCGEETLSGIEITTTNDRDHVYFTRAFDDTRWIVERCDRRTHDVMNDTKIDIEIEEQAHARAIIDAIASMIDDND